MQHSEIVHIEKYPIDNRGRNAMQRSEVSISEKFKNKVVLDEHKLIDAGFSIPFINLIGVEICANFEESINKTFEYETSKSFKLSMYAMKGKKVEYMVVWRQNVYDSKYNVYFGGESLPIKCNIFYGIDYEVISYDASDGLPHDLKPDIVEYLSNEDKVIKMVEPTVEVSTSPSDNTEPTSIAKPVKLSKNDPYIVKNKLIFLSPKKFMGYFFWKNCHIYKKILFWIFTIFFTYSFIVCIVCTFTEELVSLVGVVVSPIALYFILLLLYVLPPLNII